MRTIFFSSEKPVFMILTVSRVSEPACFGAAPGIFYPEPAPAPGEREHNVGIFLN